MSTFKRSISLLLAMIVLVGVFAPVTQAAPAEETASVNTDNVTSEGPIFFALAGNTQKLDICRDIWNHIHAWESKE